MIRRDKRGRVATIMGFDDWEGDQTLHLVYRAVPKEQEEYRGYSTLCDLVLVTEEPGVRMVSYRTESSWAAEPLHCRECSRRSNDRDRNRDTVTDHDDSGRGERRECRAGAAGTQ